MQEKLSFSEVRLFKMDFEKVLDFLRSYAKKLVDEGKAELMVYLFSQGTTIQHFLTLLYYYC